MNIPASWFPDENIASQLPFLKSHYNQIIIISHRAHIKQIENNYDDYLIVSTDWLSWVECLKKGMHAIHLDSMMGEWPTSETDDPEKIYIDHCNWMYRTGIDISLFLGVSIGKQFNREIGLMTRGWIRMWHGLDRVIRTYSPTKITFYDLREDMDALDGETKWDIIKSVSDHHHIDVTDQFSPRPVNDTGFQEVKGFRAQAVVNQKKEMIRGIYAALIGFFFYIRNVFSKKPAVFFQLNPNTIQNLLENYLPTDQVRPVVIATEMPKNLKFLFRCWIKGIQLTRLPFAKLSKSDLVALDQIRASSRMLRDEAALGLESAKLNYVTRLLSKDDALFSLCVTIKRYRQLFNRHKFSEIVIGDSENALCRTLIELSKNSDANVNELLNGIFVTKTQFDTRCGDGYRLPLVNRMLSWGHHEKNWLEELGTKLQVSQCGYPGINHLKSLSEGNQLGRTRALILPFGPDRSDIKGLRSNTFSYLVNIVDMLFRLEFTEIHVKLHPGAPNLQYYQDIMDLFGFDVLVCQQVDLLDQVKWADIVIGPVNSGAMIETIATGTPYFPMCSRPTSIQKSLTQFVNPTDNVEDLERKIRNSDFPEQKKVLNYLCSYGEISNASRSVWKVLSGLPAQ